MKVIRDEEKASLTLVSTSEEEQRDLISFIEVLQSGEKIEYDGRIDEDKSGKFTQVRLKVNDRVIILRGDTEEEKLEINDIRNLCYFSTSGLIYLDHIEIGNQAAIITTGRYCKHCGQAMINRFACEWKTCDACAEKCQHQYERGAVWGPRLDIGVGEFCGLCGRGKPKVESEREKTQLEHHLDAEMELGVTIIYKNGPPTTPIEAALHQLSEEKEV